MKLWFVSGSGRGVGKTHLALALCRELPRAAYAKVGHAPRKPRKQPNYFRSESGLQRWLRVGVGEYENVVVESNALALRADRKATVVFIDAPGDVSSARSDAAALRARADIRITDGERQWLETLDGVLRDAGVVRRLVGLFKDQQEYLDRGMPSAEERIREGVDASVAGCILAGGRGGRMGGPTLKGLLEHSPGRTMVEHLAEEMRGAGITEILLNANDRAGYAGFGLPVVPDVRPWRGPLSGIEAGLEYVREHALGTAVLFLPCDVPALGRREIARLRDVFTTDRAGIVMAVVAGAEFPAQPTCCVLSLDLLPRVRAALDVGHQKIGTLWRDLGAREVAFDDPRPFLNVNTSSDLARWRRR